MLTQDEIKELKFFADKVADVHGPEHSEYLRINEILKDVDYSSIKEDYLKELKILTNNYTIPEGACNAQTRLLNLLNKMDKDN
ncbi:MAG: hypothetical protein QM490_00355 [Candidatus Gracilibacteria bacterium]